MAACCRLPVCGVLMSKPLDLAMRLHLLCHLKTDIQNTASQLLLHIDTVSDNKKPFVITGLVTVIAWGLYTASSLLLHCFG